jgi:hypothetical protein
MDFLRRLMGRGGQPTHSVVVTPAAAAAIRGIMSQQRFDPRRGHLLLDAGVDGGITLDLSEDEAERRSEENAVATSNGVVVVIPRVLVDAFHDLVVDHQGGGFSFRGSAAPQYAASHPGRVQLSRTALFALSPEFRDDAVATDGIAWHLEQGDSRAAVVVSVAPLVVAAYTDELDAVALLTFPERLVADHGLKVGKKLLTVNLYASGQGTATDLVRGEAGDGTFRDFTPLIADFLTADPKRVTERKAKIDLREWQRTFSLGREAMSRARGRFRDGRPPNSGRPAY